MSLRLDQRGARVLCGVVDCGARVGHVHNNNGPRMLVLMPGYRRSPDGIFRVTPHAVDRLRRKHLPRERGRQNSGLGAEDPTPSVTAAVRPCCLPVRVRCWKCRWVHDAVAGQLRVENEVHSWAHGRKPGRRFGPDDHEDAMEAWLPESMARE